MKGMNTMDDGMLSQDEIDALLNVSIDDPDEDENHTSNHEDLTDIEKDTLGEIGNISFGSSATTLSTLLNQKVDITTPEVSVISRDQLNKDCSYDHVNIQVKYLEGFSGNNIFVLKSVDAAVISDIMLGGDGTSPEEVLNDIHLSAVQEAMNQMMGAAATSMSTVFNKRVDISPPSIEHKQDEELIRTDDLTEYGPVVKISFQLKVGELVDSRIMQLMPIQFAQELVDQLLNANHEEPTIASEQPKQDELEQDVLGNKNDINSRDVRDVLKGEDNIHEHKQSEPQYIGHPVHREEAQVEQAAFSEFQPTELNKNEQRNLDMLFDIPLKVSVELGRTQRTIKEILELSAGSIVELDKLAGEPVDILINQKLIATGEVVVIDENFGVRVTDIVSHSDRLRHLK